jgi:hypothetical protein
MNFNFFLFLKIFLYWKISREKNNILNNNGSQISSKSSVISSQKETKIVTNKIKRRSETFAEAELRLKTRNIEVGILGPGEISGMCEIIFDMPTYMQSTKCIEECDVFYIFKRSYDRLISKRNPSCINKMKETVQMKLEARNRRLKISTPIQLYRSLQYKLELTRKRQQQKETPEIENTHQTSYNTSFSLPRGPIIQLDLRPKSAAYFNMLKKSDKLNKSPTIDEVFNIRNNDLNSQKSKRNEEIENFVETIENLNDLNFADKYHQHSELQKRNAYSNKSFHYQQHQTNKLKFNDQDRTNNQAMEQLENRIKRWHLDFGGNKACVAKFNRIDINVS